MSHLRRKTPRPACQCQCTHPNKEAQELMCTVGFRLLPRLAVLLLCLKLKQLGFTDDSVCFKARAIILLLRTVIVLEMLVP